MKDWINLFTNETGTVTDSSVDLGSDRLILATNTINLSTGRPSGLKAWLEGAHTSFTILETDRSGAVTMKYPDGSTSYGDAEVYLVLQRERGQARFLSAPLHVPITLLGLTRVQLVILAPAGPVGTEYHVLCNAHCVFETEMNVEFESNPWHEASGWRW